MNQEDINKDLKEQSSSDLQGNIAELVRSKMKTSAQAMEHRFTSWDKADELYRGYRPLDQEDSEAMAHKAPPKVILPVAYAQIQTFLAFMHSAFTSRKRVFELSGRSGEDQRMKEGLERDIQYQVNHNKFPLILYLWALDTTKYGIGVTKNYWTRKERKVRSFQRKTGGADPGALFDRLGRALGLKGQPSQLSPGSTRGEEVTKAVVEYEGTEIINVSPYCFYPDPSVPIKDFQKGNHVGHEEEVTISYIRSFEGDRYFGTHHVEDKIENAKAYARPRAVGRSHFSHSSAPIGKNITTAGSVSGETNLNGNIILTEVEFTTTVRSLKNDWEIDFDFPGHSDDQPIKFVAALANDSKVLQFEPLGYLHDLYNYDVTEYSPDHNNFLNPGIVDTIYEMQDMMTWFLNSHVQNVRKAIKNRFIGNPERVHTDDINSGREFIRTKGTNKDLNQILQQLPVTDVTKNHVTDMNVLNQFIQFVTGISENALGQFSQGRRSATEARAVNSATSSRMKMHASLMWSQGLEPLGRKILSNTQQLRSEEIYEMIMGDEVESYPFEKAVLSPPEKIVGGYDFIPRDGTLPSDNQQRAVRMQELVKNMASSEILLKSLPYDMGKIVKHIFELHGIHDMEQFSPDDLSQASQQTPQAQVLSNEEFQQQREEGQGQDVDPAGDNILQALASR